MDQVQQEEVLMEVEEVVHHHVVSAIMASEFRNVLERHLEVYLKQSYLHMIIMLSIRSLMNSKRTL